MTLNALFGVPLMARALSVATDIVAAVASELRSPPEISVAGL
jgi:hypothetical protein